MEEIEKSWAVLNKKQTVCQHRAQSRVKCALLAAVSLTYSIWIRLIHSYTYMNSSSCHLDYHRGELKYFNSIKRGWRRQHSVVSSKHAPDGLSHFPRFEFQTHVLEWVCALGSKQYSEQKNPFFALKWPLYVLICIPQYITWDSLAIFYTCTRTLGLLMRPPQPETCWSGGS